MRGRFGFRFGMSHIFVSRIETSLERPVETSEHMNPISVFFFNIVKLLLHIACIADF